MKKLLLTLFLGIALLFSSNVSAQTQTVLRAQGGYSWVNGVAGAELQMGQIGLSCGWMPTKMPMSGTKINSISFAVTGYTNKPFDGDVGYYITLGEASNGFRYEDSWGGEATSPMTIVMAGICSSNETANFKIGGGYGWCEYGNSWTFEITLGITLFSNKNKF